MSSQHLKTPLGLLATIVLLGLGACNEVPKDASVPLGTKPISDHQTPHGTFNRRECLFRVVLPEITLTYTSSIAEPVQLGKCKAMKNGDLVTVMQKFKLFEDGHKEQARY